MKRLLIIIFTFTINLGFSQTKEQLIDSLIKVNRVEYDFVGIGCAVGIQYARFQKLKEKLTHTELLKLLKHRNPTIRTYASMELIQSGKGNVLQMLSSEIQKNDYVETYEGCIMDIEPISSIIYHGYWNKIRSRALTNAGNSNFEQELVMKKALETDFTIEKLDGIIINSNKDVYWLLYDRAFENRKHKESYLSRIEELAFDENNSYAFDYLKKHYSSKYSERLNKYLTTEFPKARFRTENQIFYFHSFIETLLESKNEKFKKIATDKLKTEDSWKEHSGWFKTTLKKHGIVL